MSNAMLARPEVVEPVAELQRHDDHRFFDPRSPEQPEQILGLDTEAVLRLGRAATALGALPPRVNLGLYVLPDAVRLMPLVEEMQSGATLTPEDVRPYRKPIKRLSMEVSFADTAAAAASALAVGIPLRRALNRRVEREFPVRVAKVIEEAREAVAGVEHEVDFVASFENPKEQFVSEVNTLAETVSSAITQQRDRRVRSGVQQVEVEPETPRGLAGFFTKAVRKVRSFFGMFRRNKPAVNPEITAYDAGAGIEQTLNSLTRDQRNTEGRFPMLSKLVLSRLPNNMSLTKDRLALVAPEILNFLFSTSPDDDNANRLIDSVNRNPHELRFVTRFKKHYGRYSLEGIQRASHTLFPAIRDVLPNEGAKVREIFTQAQDLLQRKQPEVDTAEESNDANQANEAPHIGFRNRLKRLFRRSR